MENERILTEEEQRKKHRWDIATIFITGALVMGVAVFAALIQAK